MLNSSLHRSYILFSYLGTVLKLVGSNIVCNYLFQADQTLTPWSGVFFCKDFVIKTFLWLLIQEAQLSVHGERLYSQYWQTASWRHVHKVFDLIKKLWKNIPKLHLDMHFISFSFFFTGSYLYIESSLPRKQGDNAVLQSQEIPIPQNSGKYCFVFWYFMHGATVGSLNISYQLQNDNRKTQIWSKSGEQGRIWKQAFAEISVIPSSFHVSFYQ